ncbi:MAG TPA: response regulator [Polyangiaceae bacterium]|jgi:two-component system copper resistance phosphate regulon response regulator CusR|nr:response regulator [Polyangiaceae bacterium]
MASILILDDDVAFGDLTRRRLERQGFSVQLHGGVHGAMNALLRAKFDLVILDVKMPGMTGPDVIKLIRGSNTGDVKVMFYSSSDALELRRLADQHGAQGYITKMASTDELEIRVREVLGEPRSRRGEAPGEPRSRRS